MRALVLGGSGFVGRPLTESLRARGIRVSAPGSGSLDLLSASAPEALAAEMNRDTVLFVPIRARAADSLAGCTREVAMAVSIARGIAISAPEAIVFFSTLSVYSDDETNLDITEDTSIAPSSHYGTGKFAAESVVRRAALEHGVRAVVLRPCKIYGPGDQAHTYGPVRFIERLLHDGTIEIFGDGSEARDFVYVRDVVRVATELGLGRTGGIFNVGTGTSHSFQEIVAVLQVLAGAGITVRQLPRSRPRVDQRVNPSRLLQALGGFQFTKLEDGLRRTFSHYRAMESGVVNG